MNNFKFHWLIFKYDFEKLSKMRKEFDNHNDDITFRYACASVKTFLANNPTLANNVYLWTDDVALLTKVFNFYNVKTPNIIDIKDEIEQDKKHPYPWNVKSMFLVRHFGGNSFFVDNDCICKSNVESLVNSINDSSVAFWEFERKITDTRPYWGWQMATEYLKRPFSYWVANDGIIGTSEATFNKGIMNKSLEICHDLYQNVDISSRFPDRHPKLMISQQMAVCFAAQDLGLNLVESKNFFDHHYINKDICLKYL